MNKKNKIWLSLFYLRRSRHRQSRAASFFEASSIGDLAFLLLIYFIVTSSFLLRQGIFLSLPAKSTGSIKVEKDRLVHIHPQSQGFSWEGKNISRQKLLQFLKEKNNLNKDTIAVVYMQDALPYERLVDSLSVVRESGIKKISLNQTDKNK